ncbi:MAG: hypothetical protein LAO19_10050 [Acidobacteriia bacterium]|nr:hypothetical protein [Terriglobia bacterium]
MNRRELLLLAVNRRTRSVELSCERLYMNYCDSQLDNTTQEFFERLESELRVVDDLHLMDTAWLASAEFRERLEPLLNSIRARGGRVTRSTEPIKKI